jgi:excinuclease ABC subunit C
MSTTGLWNPCRIEPETLRRRLAALPTSSGVYMYKNDAGDILYIGKAINLRNRVRSYFHRNGQTTKVKQMISQVVDWELILTGSELEALVLECNLIKKHRPKYNVRLRDDKHYPYIKVTVDEDWPRVFITRRIARDGAKYFGPFTDSRSVWRTLDLLNKLFPYRTCHITITGNLPRPCLQYHIHRCLGPCIGAADAEEYRAVIQQVTLFLEGKHEQIVSTLRQRMERAAEDLLFERAAHIRDQIRSVEKVTERQRVVDAAMKDQDVIAFARANGDACVEVFFVRGGKLIGREHFLLEGTKDEDAEAIMTSFVTQFYNSAAFVPPEILLQNEVAEAEVIESWLRDKRGGQKVAVSVPRRGKSKQLVDMVATNATEVLAQMRAKWLADERKTSAALTELADYLDLEEPPTRIECYDISNIQGTSSVGSMIVFENGQPANGAYRRFQIKTIEGANDFASLQEVLRRRFARAGARSADDGGAQEPDAANVAKGWTRMPDLIIIDGGKGQLNAGLEVLQKLGLERVQTVSLAKQNEEIFTPHSSEPILLPRDSQALYLVQRIRDEAHRFALTYHRKLRGRRTVKSLLDDLPGVGPKRKAALLRQFGSVKGIREATLDELVATPGVDRATATRVKERL